MITRLKHMIARRLNLAEADLIRQDVTTLQHMIENRDRQIALLREAVLLLASYAPISAGNDVGEILNPTAFHDNSFVEQPPMFPTGYERKV